MTPLRRLIFVSSNVEKHREIRAALLNDGVEVERVALDLPGFSRSTRRRSRRIRPAALMSC